jgi:hypothetical protein
MVDNSGPHAPTDDLSSYIEVPEKRGKFIRMGPGHSQALKAPEASSGYKSIGASGSIAFVLPLGRMVGVSGLALTGWRLDRAQQIR